MCFKSGFIIRFSWSGQKLFWKPWNLLNILDTILGFFLTNSGIFSLSLLLKLESLWRWTFICVSSWRCHLRGLMTLNEEVRIRKKVSSGAASTLPSGKKSLMMKKGQWNYSACGCREMELFLSGMLSKASLRLRGSLNQQAPFLFNHKVEKSTSFSFFLFVFQEIPTVSIVESPHLSLKREVLPLCRLKVGDLWRKEEQRNGW